MSLGHSDCFVTGVAHGGQIFNMTSHKERRARISMQRCIKYTLTRCSYCFIGGRIIAVISGKM